MDAAAVVTIAIATVVVLVLAAYLIAVIRVLVDTSGKLTTVIAAVGAIVQKTEPVEPVVRSINGSLTKAQDVLMSLLESKAGDQGAADLIASVDPLAGTPSSAAPDRPEALRPVRAELHHSPKPDPPAEDAERLRVRPYSTPTDR